MGMTVVEKILAKNSNRNCVMPGDELWADIDIAFTRDVVGPNVVNEFYKHGIVKKIWDASKVAVAFDTYGPPKNENIANNQKIMRHFVEEQGIFNFYDINSGIGQQVLIEEGIATPGSIIAGTDSHMSMIGGIGALSVGVGTSDMVAALILGKLWFRVPSTIYVNLEGALQEAITTKDVILYLIDFIGSNGAIYKAIEYGGSFIETTSLSERLTLCNMSIDMGAKVGLVEPDDNIIDYIKKRSEKSFQPLFADNDAEYEKKYHIDVSNIEPLVSCPYQVSNITTVKEVEGTKLNQVFIGSCTNGRIEDLRIAASILRGKRINRNVRLIVVPASRETYKLALKEGIMEILIDSGATVCNPQCSLCCEGHPGILAPKEVCLSTSNRNFKHKLGFDSEVYLASPFTAAVSAISGEITDPRKL